MDGSSVLNDTVCKLHGKADIQERMQGRAGRSEQERKPDPGRTLERRHRLADRLLSPASKLDSKLIQIDSNGSRTWIRIQQSIPIPNYPRRPAETLFHCTTLKLLHRSLLNWALRQRLQQVLEFDLSERRLPAQGLSMEGSLPELFELQLFVL